MLVMVITGAYYDLKSQGPEILGYCSLSTRDSKDTNDPAGGNLLRGVDRAKLLKNRRLKVW